MLVLYPKSLSKLSFVLFYVSGLWSSFTITGENFWACICARFPLGQQLAEFFNGCIQWNTVRQKFPNCWYTVGTQSRYTCRDLLTWSANRWSNVSSQPLCSCSHHSIFITSACDHDWLIHQEVHFTVQWNGQNMPVEQIRKYVMC